MVSIQHKLQDEFKTLAKKILNAKSDLAVYGGGQIGRKMYSTLVSMGYKINAVLDKNPAWDGCFYDTPVIHPDNYNKTDDVVIICLHTDFESVYNFLTSRGFHKILPYFFYILEDNVLNNDDYYDYYLKKWSLSPPPPNLNIFFSIDVPITMKCSLKCRDCANLMQYFKQPENADFNKMRTALEKLLRTLDKCHEIRILGGEPLCNPEIYKYIEMLDDFKDKYEWIIVLTNGTIIPNKQTIESFKGRKLFVRISDYQMPKNKIGDLTNLLDKNGILYSVTKWAKWQDCGCLKNYDRTIEKNEEILRECCVSYVPAIVDGKLFRCPYSGNMYTLLGQEANIPEFVDLLGDESPDKLLEKIRHLMSKKYLRACDFCGGRPLDGYSIPAAIQTGKPLDYSIRVNTEGARHQI